jgi:hypothetical protein
VSLCVLDASFGESDTSAPVQVLDAGNDEMPRAPASGVQKAPRHEVAGSLAPAVPRALWGFDFRAGGDGGLDAGTRRPAWVCAREPGSVQWVSRSSRRPYRRAVGSLISVIGPREIAAGSDLEVEAVAVAIETRRRVLGDERL